MAEEEVKEEKPLSTHIYGLRTTANREDQVMDFVSSNADKKKFQVYSIIRPHGMRGYIFLEAESKQEAEQAAFNIPYARGILPKEIDYKEIEHMLEMVKVERNIRKSDIVEIISGPFKRENAKVTRIDKVKEEVVVELLEAAVPIPITVKMDAVKVIRRESEEEEVPEEETPVHIPSPEKKEAPIEFAEGPKESLPMPETGEKEALPMPSAQTTKESDSAPKNEPKEESIVEKAKDIVEDVKEAAEDVVEKVEEVLHIKKKGEKKEVKEETDFTPEDIESIDDISDEEVEEEVKKKKKESKEEKKEEKKEKND